MSKKEFVDVARISLKLSPYKIVSTAGNTLTVIGGLRSSGKYDEVKYSATHVRMGKALKKNCDVAGMMNKVPKKQ